MRVLAVRDTTAAATPPKVTEAPASKSAPDSATVVPPAVGPEAGVAPVSDGGGMTGAAV